jgi:hypothetical protein
MQLTLPRGPQHLYVSFTNPVLMELVILPGESPETRHRPRCIG